MIKCPPHLFEQLFKEEMKKYIYALLYTYIIHNTEPIKTVNKKIKTNKGKLGVTFYRICLATN